MTADQHAAQLAQSLARMVTIWEGPRERAALEFAAAIVDARRILAMYAAHTAPKPGQPALF
jgi:hypothetical protein